MNPSTSGSPGSGFAGDSVMFRAAFGSSSDSTSNGGYLTTFTLTAGDVDARYVALAE